MLDIVARRQYQHLTPRYIVDRLWLMAHERRHPDAPWLTAEAVAFLERWLQPDHIGFEWGSGRSTVWFARRVRYLTSVEHDRRWYAEVTRRLNTEGLTRKVSCLLFEADGEISDPGHPYTHAVSEMPDNALDFCLVDGVTGLRAHCALAGLPKVKPSGIVIVDNANWFIPREPKSRAPNSRGPEDGYASPAWQEFGRQVADWRRVWTTNGVTDTALWVKPA